MAFLRTMVVSDYLLSNIVQSFMKFVNAIIYPSSVVVNVQVCNEVQVDMYIFFKVDPVVSLAPFTSFVSY